MLPLSCCSIVLMENGERIENECRLTGGINYAALRRFRRNADGTRARIASFSILHFTSISKPFHNAFYEGFFFRRKQRFPAVNQRIASQHAIPEPILHRTRLCRLHDRCIADFFRRSARAAASLSRRAANTPSRYSSPRAARTQYRRRTRVRLQSCLLPLCSVTSLYCAKPASSISLWSFQSFGSLSVTAMMVRPLRSAAETRHRPCRPRKAGFHADRTVVHAQQTVVIAQRMPADRAAFLSRRSAGTPGRLRAAAVILANSCAVV